MWDFVTRHSGAFVVFLETTTPHMRLIGCTATVPLALADRADADTVLGLARGISPLHPIPPTSGFARSPIAVALAERAPDSMRANRMVETTNTLENQFIVLRARDCGGRPRSLRACSSPRLPERAERHLDEVGDSRALLSRWRLHPALVDVPAARQRPVNSTVLRGRAGYREVTRFFVDLQARTRLLDQADARQLLELRDAALIYEYWC